MKDYTGRDEAIIEQALQLPAAEHSAFLDRACGGDAELRRRVEGMLSARQAASAAAEKPAANATSGTGSWPTNFPRPAVVGERVGRYKLLQELGEGGCGMVFMAEQEEPVRRRVALKIIKLGMDTAEVIARFEAERQALAMMDHPNIAKVYDAGATPAGRPYFVMELVRGVPITDFCNESKLSNEERLKLFIPVCNAIQHAHQKGIIHRDIKPSNVLITLHDGVPVPKVIDFGIAKATNGRLTDKTLFTPFEQFVGTPAYMSPEQAEMSGLDVDTRTDIYSLGVMLYELLTSETPLDAKKLHEAGVDEIRRRIREDEPDRPSSRLSTFEGVALATVAQQRHTDAPKLISGLRGDLDWIVMRCLEKDRQRRYDNASDLALDIQRHLKNEPVSAGPPSAFYILEKFSRRHRTSLATAATIVILLVVATGVSLWQAHRAELAAAEADRQTTIAKQQTEETKREKQQVQLAYNRMDVTAALDEIEEGNANDAVAYLDRALRTVPDNANAASLLYSLLGNQKWLLPAASFQSPTSTFAINSTTGRIAVAGPDNMVRVYDIATAQQVSPPMPQNGTVAQIEFSADGSRLFTAVGTPVQNNPPRGGATLGTGAGRGGRGRAANVGQRGRGGQRGNQGGNGGNGLGRGPASFPGPIFIWDVATGKKVSVLPAPGLVGFSFAHLSADGQKLAIATRTLFGVWDIATGLSVSSLLPPGFPAQNGSIAMQLSPDGRKLLIVRRNTRDNLGDFFELWDVSAGQSKLIFDLKPLERQFSAAAFSPDGMRLVIAEGNTARLYDATTGRAIPSQPMHHEEVISTVAFSGDGRRVITGSADNTARVWDAATGQPLSAPMLNGGAVSVAAFNSDGQSVFTASAGGGVQKWDFPSADGTPAPTRIGMANLQGALFSSDGHRVVTFAPNNMVQVWDSITFQPLAPPWHRDSGAAVNAGGTAFSPDGHLLAMESDNQTIRVWDAATGQPVSPPIKQSNPISMAVFSADGKRLAVATNDNALRVWDAATGQAVSPVLQLDGTFFTATFSTDGLNILTATRDRVVRIWDVATGESTTSALRLDEQAQAVDFSYGPDGHYALVAVDNVARVWKMDTGLPFSAPMKMDAPINRVFFSPDGTRAVTVARETASQGGPPTSTIQVWDADTGDPVSLPLRGLGPNVILAFGPDEKDLLAMTRDGELRAWPLPESVTAASAWILDLAATLAQCQVDLTGTPVFDRGQALDALRREAIQSTDAANPFVELARQILAPTPPVPSSATSAPASAVK